ncbi:hypothetical protein COY93_01440 [Candidatus Uhrbacteria bacterium CG_4_10_14_0_8_um_filter_58_22]|uniref:Uncharacterized protein n=1 Tax=Candidatus Uhrbacteria bacterium CG_4_10_14_0_8_um_filter_58_22 TaxID=1975029 RepID=A0A2M7QAG4_9BACT|nr:MAG: hypothetical protein AUJ19_02530 [Parcubacteria group bacterium CG1_02_58_44]PIY63073.1 MAG: hypothetical protein COY93_01440 [Candidatus Uhrbacteria bacterium CG_4_10_14_0_8_um_filter_58_22]
MQETIQVGQSTAAEPKPRLLARICDAVTKWSLIVLVFLIPVFVLPWTTEAADFNKQMLLFLGVSVAAIAWMGKMLAERRFEYRRSVVNIVVLVFLGVYGLSTWLSVNPYLSLTGNYGQARDGLLTVIALAVLYFVTINSVQTESELRRLLTAVVGGGFVAVAYGLLQGLGIFVLPFAFAGKASFNTVGTVSALGILAAFLVMLCSGLLLYGHGRPSQPGVKAYATKVLLIATSVISLWLVAAIGFWPVTVALLISSLVLIGYTFVHASSLRGLNGVILPAATVVVTILALLFSWSLGLHFPLEVMPSTSTSFDIATQTIRDFPFLGSGPGTYIFDFAKYHTAELNNTNFWNVRFDRGSSRFLTLLPSVGLLGILTWLLISLLLLGSAAKKLLKADEATWHILIGIFSAWLLLVLSKFLYSSSLTLEVLFWVTMALLVVVHKHDFYSVRFEKSPRASMLVTFAFILGLVFILSGAFVQVQRYSGEVAFARAMEAKSSQNYDLAIEQLVKATNLNKHNDVYQRNLAMVLISKTEQLAANQTPLVQEDGESEDAFKERQTKAMQERSQIASMLTTKAVQSARTATEIGAVNVANWSVLASIYKKLIGVTEGAENWTLTTYEQASQLEPNNPSLPTEVGKMYLLLSDLARNSLAPSGKAADEGWAKVTGYLDKADEYFNRAVELKSDYGSARYNLALVLDRQGKLEEAISSMESVAKDNPKDVGVGFQLALLYYRNDQKDAATRLLESVINLTPNFSNARWYLAAMYEERGEIEKAISQIEIVQSFNPDNQQVADKLASLQDELKAGTVGDEDGELPPPVE